MYECHVTVEKPAKEQKANLEDIATSQGWKTSEIDRDPVMGEKVFFYFTMHSPNIMEIYERMKWLERVLYLWGFLPLRSKIEHIVYNTKTGVGV